jgi:hypothetical protein
MFENWIRVKKCPSVQSMDHSIAAAFIQVSHQQPITIKNDFVYMRHPVPYPNPCHTSHTHSVSLLHPLPQSQTPGKTSPHPHPSAARSRRYWRFYSDCHSELCELEVTSRVVNGLCEPAYACWRTGRDSNPRCLLKHTRFPGVPDRPLWHPSVTFVASRSQCGVAGGNSSGEVGEFMKDE